MNARFRLVLAHLRKLALSLVALTFVLLIFWYTSAVLQGRIAPDNRIGFPELGLLVIAGFLLALVLRPGLFDNLAIFQAGSFKLKWLTSDRGLGLLIPLLLPENEQDHLMNLAAETTQKYEGKASLRAELWRLESLKLIRIIKDKDINAIKDDAVFDLADIVRLTDLGYEWAARLKTMNRSAKKRGADASAEGT